MSDASERKRVLFIGQTPETVDFSDPALPPGTDAAKIHAGIKAGMQQMLDRGLDPVLCLVDPATAATEVAHQLAAKSYACVVLGAGLRLPPRSLHLFETLINVVHKSAPTASIAFNTSPQDTADAAARWLPKA
ncbi:MAG TPA: hypothetical protein VFX59_01530 [Polyangiales bacterium]|nr:hypothetical protein [Polyangiales bacterium]